MGWARYKTNAIDDFTLLLEKLALNIAKKAEKNDKRYMIGSGFAIDFFIGKISRNHHDVDFHPLQSDTKWWTNWFEKLGYRVVCKDRGKDGKTYEVLGNENELLVDIWPIYQEGIFKNSICITYKGIKINIEDPYKVLKNKACYKRKLRPQDLHDFSSLGKTPSRKICTD